MQHHSTVHKEEIDRLIGKVKRNDQHEWITVTSGTEIKGQECPQKAFKHMWKRTTKKKQFNLR